MKEKKLQITAVSYLNTLPFVYGIDYSGILKNFKLSLEVPSKCAENFKNGKADIALIPVGALLQLKNYKYISDYCIGSKGNVKTVLLLSQIPLQEIKSIYLDEHSLTSVNLVRILAKHFWNINPVWIDSNKMMQGSMQDMESLVAIGNKTFQLEKKFKYVYDLSDEWLKFTGLPFTFACWVMRDDLSSEFIAPFVNTLKWGLAHKKESIEKLFNPSEFPGIDIYSYLEKNIDFDFDIQKHKALEIFIDYMKNR
ncbi:MAG TPA: menaquinone biosynthesis protein [Bacteroidales bacterium]|nr:menaquinone biosynthesis protein [Bacteroidales bacterium]HPS18352.1 menaquinone biosynthesis protein [Bacteroidales bacterium]